MSRKITNKILFIKIIYFILISPLIYAEESFLLVDANTGNIILKKGNEEAFTQLFSPFSTFKIVLSLIGYDTGILIDEKTPEWPYEGQDVSFDAWKSSHTPKTWMDYSVVWYSRILTHKLGLETMQHYLSLFDYGNQDLTGDPGKNNGLTRAWLNSSLKISMIQQVAFLKKLAQENLPASSYAIKMTKNLLYNESIQGGWNLFGKTGSGSSPSNSDKMNAWYVGWVTKDSQTCIFALLFRNVDSVLPKKQRQEIVSGYLLESGIIE